MPVLITTIPYCNGELAGTTRQEKKERYGSYPDWKRSKLSLVFCLTWSSVYKVLWNPVFEKIKANKWVQQGCEVKDI